MKDLIKLLLLTAALIWHIVSIVGVVAFTYFIQDHLVTLQYFDRNLICSYITMSIWYWLVKDDLE